MAEMKTKGGEVKNIMVEHSANPAWMVVQALPSVALPQSDNVVDQCAALYANMLGRHVATLYPNIKNAVDAWQQADGNATSRLQQNEDLKEIMLRETPWMADAESEADRMARLSEFFDNNNISNRKRQKRVSLTRYKPNIQIIIFPLSSIRVSRIEFLSQRNISFVFENLVL